MSEKALMLKGKPLIAPESIKSSQFDTMAQLIKLVDQQDLPYGVLTKAAFAKVERMFTYDL